MSDKPTQEQPLQTKKIKHTHDSHQLYYLYGNTFKQQTILQFQRNISLFQTLPRITHQLDYQIWIFWTEWMGDMSTGEVDALEGEGVDGVVEGIGRVHAKILHVLLHQALERLLRYRPAGDLGGRHLFAGGG